MTIATTTNKSIARGNGASTSFSFNFPVRQVSDLSFLYTDPSGNQSNIAPSNVTVTLNPIPAGGIWAIGGSVTYAPGGSPIPTGSSLTILRTVGYTQTTSIVNQGGFFPTVVETALDLMTMSVQQLAASIGNAVTAPASDTSLMTLPSAAARANGILAFDSAGNVSIINKQTGAPVFTPSMWMAQNIAQLKTFSGMIGGVSALTLGGTTVGDGSAYVYYWNATDTTADNGSTVIQPNSGGTGRWNAIPMLFGIATLNVAGAANIGGAETVTGLLTANGGMTLTGLMTFLSAVSQLVPGATSFSVRNHANNADNFLLTDAGAGTVRGPLAWGTGAPTYGMVVKRKTADQSVSNSTTPQNDNDLFFAIAANEEWAVEFSLPIGAALGTTGITFDLGVPTGATFRFSALVASDAKGSSWGVTESAALGFGVSWAGAALGGTNGFIKASGWILNGANAGNVQLKWAQGSLGATALTVFKGASLNATRVA